jgi:hypothetical protein
VVVSWCDPDWLLFLSILLLPAVAGWSTGASRKAGFFLGAAIYVAVLKWLGWAVLGRRSQVVPGFLLFPAEVFAGLALACGWVYFRNLAAWIFPGSYSLHELSFLFLPLLGLHLVGLVLKIREWLASGEGTPWWRGLLDHAGMFLPYAAALAAALWTIADAPGVQGTDPMFYTFTARVYLQEGMAFAVPPLESPISYPSAFGAMNAVAAAVAPLSVVQAFHLQHVLLCVTSLFLVIGTVAAIAGRPLVLLHGLVLPFLFVFPLYALYPDIFYPGTPKQAGPPLCAAICLMPLVMPVARRGAFLTALAASALLPPLTVALNPACALYAAVAVLAASALLAWRTAGPAGWSRARIVVVYLALVLAGTALVLGTDRYYGPMIFQVVRRATIQNGTGPAASEAPAETMAHPALLNPAGVWPMVKELDPVGLSPHVSTTGLSAPQLDRLAGWPQKLPQRLVVLVALGLSLLALAAHLRPAGAASAGRGRALAGVVLAGLLLWLALKLAALALAGMFAIDHPHGRLLQGYTRYLLLRCELLLLFTLLASSLAALFLTAQRRGFFTGRRGVAGAAALVAGCWLGPVAGLWSGIMLSGPVTVPLSNRFPVTDDDLQLVAWANENLPPEKGAIGLAAWTFSFSSGQGTVEEHMVPLGGGHAFLVYGKHHNIRFALAQLEGEANLSGYKKHVRDEFDPDWCRTQGIRYFYATPEGLRQNPGLQQAVEKGYLRPVQSFGPSFLYEVVGKTPG